MLFAKKPTDEEVSLLTEYYTRGPSHLIRSRAHAVILSAKGITAPVIADMLDRPARTVRVWIREWNKERLASILPRYSDNQNAAKLTTAQKQEIRDTLERPPSARGLPGALWTLPALKHHIKTVFGVVYESDQSYYYLLKHIGYSWKLPSPFDSRRDDELVKRRMEEICQELEPYLNDDRWVVLAADETRISWEEDIRRAWLKRGEKTVIKLNRDSEGQSWFGALNLKTGREHLYRLPWQNTEEIITVLVKLTKRYPNKKLCIVWDNAGWHKSKQLRLELKDRGKLQHIHLIPLPPYAPDKNPQEHVWKYGKEKLANTHFDTFENMKKKFNKLVNNKVFNYKIG